MVHSVCDCLEWLRLLYPIPAATEPGAPHAGPATVRVVRWLDSWRARRYWGRDRDKSNYRIENLELLSKGDHAKVHAGWVRDDSGWIAKLCTGCLLTLPLNQFYPRKGHTPSAMCRPCTNRESVAAIHANTERQERRRKYQHDWYESRKAVPA